jgi:hypothetical protein
MSYIDCPNVNGTGKVDGPVVQFFINWKRTKLGDVQTLRGVVVPWKANITSHTTTQYARIVSNTTGTDMISVHIVIGK